MAWAWASRKTACVAGLAAALLGTTGAVHVAQAQGLFEILRGILRGHAPRVERVVPPRLLEDFPHGGIEAPPRETGGPEVAYCVRLCDGRYFPLPANAGAPSSSPQQICRAMCPSARTKIFFGSDISHAVADDGQSYSGSANAFVYRDRLDENCTCTGSGPTGVKSLEPENDPTLRPGDIVVTRDGPKIFAGDPRVPHASNEFRAVQSYRRLPNSLRRELSGIRVHAETRMSAAEARTLSEPRRLVRRGGPSRRQPGSKAASENRTGLTP